MIYNEKYRIKFYRNSRTGNRPVRDYIHHLEYRQRTKIYKYLEYLRDHGGYLDEPYSRHIVSGIRELRVDFSNHHHRLLYFCFIGRTIVILHAFLKKVDKTPPREINTALGRYYEIINNCAELYEEENIQSR
ncbi:MAG: type II toxin-antitoxin system RelE/ParE family toxin [Patescibacteria group bacterium]